jgi:uncharacterized protein (TIRG00374 family)
VTSAKLLRVLVTGGIVALLVLFATRVDWQSIGATLQRADPVPLLLAFLANLLSFVLKGVRWWIFLRAIGIPSFGLAMKAVFVGAALNSALVANAGEGARVIFVARAAGAPVAPVLATLALERFFDVMGYVVLLVAALYVFPLPETLQTWRPSAVAALLGMIAFVLWLAWRRPAAGENEPLADGHGVGNWVARTRHFLGRFGTSIRELSTPSRFGAALALSLAAWALIVATFAWTAASTGTPLTLAGNVAVTLAVSVGFLVRFTPGNVGVFQLAYAVTAQFFGMPRDTGVAVALLVQAVQMLPVTVIGFVVSPQFVLGESRTRDSRPAGGP